MTLAVAVIGAAGRMGAEVCRAVERDGELELVARIDRADPLELLVEGRAEVAAEFTTPASVKDNVRFCVERGVHVVVGTTGLTPDDLTEIEGWLGDGGANVLVAPNFALGAVLMMHFSAQAARHFDVAEIVERHHERKLDAPSGTALRTAELMSAARGREWAEPAGAPRSQPASRGEDAGGIRIHSVRAPGYVAHQEVVFGGTGETLTIRHDSVDRSCFMPGVILALKRVSEHPGLTVGLEQILGL